MRGCGESSTGSLPQWGGVYAKRLNEGETAASAESVAALKSVGESSLP
jgi:hypothetical protein